MDTSTAGTGTCVYTGAGHIAEQSTPLVSSSRHPHRYREYRYQRTEYTPITLYTTCIGTCLVTTHLVTTYCASGGDGLMLESRKTTIEYGFNNENH